MIGLPDIQFERRPALELLGLGDETRTEVDPEFAGFGFAVLSRVVLASDEARCELERPLVLALHTPDEPGAELELEFWLEHDGEPLAVLVPWHRFAQERVRPLLRAEHRDVVLAMCNPGGLAIGRPAWLEDRRLHHADGDVTSWLDPDGTIRLQAKRWHVR